MTPRKEFTDTLPPKKCPECNRDMICFKDYWKCEYCKAKWTPVDSVDAAMSAEQKESGEV